MIQSRTRTVVFSAGLIFFGAAAGMWLWHREAELRRYEAQIQAAATRNRQLVRQLQSTTIATANPKQQLPATSDSSSQTMPNRAAQRNDWVLATARRMPEYAQHQRAQARWSTIREYGEWFRQLNVPPERLAMIKNAFADALEKQQRGYAAMIDSDVVDQSPAFLERSKQLAEEMQSDLKQVLTDDEYASYRNFERAGTWVRYLPEIQLFLEDRGLPALSADQRRAFIEASVTESERSADNLSPGQLFRLKNERIAAIASNSLSPAQREALKEYVEFINKRTERLGNLHNPSAPDAVVYPGGLRF